MDLRRPATIKEWYVKKYPDDGLGNEMNRYATFGELYYALKSNREICVYTILGVLDSVVRERCFEELARRTGLEYDDIYKMWLS